MKRRNLKQLAPFAKFLGISKTALHDYLHARGNPQLDTLLLVADKLGISFSQLLFRGQQFDSYGRSALNAIPDEISMLHPRLRNAASLQFLALQALYDSSDKLLLDETIDALPSASFLIGICFYEQAPFRGCSFDSMFPLLLFDAYERMSLKRS